MSKPTEERTQAAPSTESDTGKTRRDFLGGSGAIAGGFIALSSRSGQAQGTPGHATPGEAQPGGRATPQNVLTRKNVVNMTAQELQSLREAILALKDRPANAPNSYVAQAGIHARYCAGPPNLQIHFRWSFLPWHRAYLYRFEQLLQAVRPGVTLPYWDWTTSRTLPPAYYQDPTSNPLFHEGRVRNPAGTNVPSLPNTMATSARVNALVAFTWAQFGGTATTTGGLELNPHNSIHGWVGGDMGQFATAGRDPIFWAHHCNVDRIWARWQSRNTSPADAAWLDFRLDPFNMTVRDTLRVESMGYRYVDFSIQFAMDRNREAGGPGFFTETIRLQEDQLQALRNREGDGGAELRLNGVEIPKRVAQEFRVFLNTPGANRDTAVEGNEAFVESFTLVPLGHADMEGMGEHPGTANIVLPIPPSATRAALRSRSELSVTVVQVPFEERENRDSEERLKVGSISLEVVR